VGFDVNGDGEITNDRDLNEDGKVTLADWERGAYIVVNSWGEKWSQDGRIYLLYSAMIDPDWKRGNFLGRAEVKRYQPERTLRLKLTCDDRSDLRFKVGISGGKDSAKAEHDFSPELLNGWPLFGKAVGRDDDGEGRLFLEFSRADGSAATGELHEAALRRYDSDGKFLGESAIQIESGKFGESSLKLEQILSDLDQK